MSETMVPLSDGGMGSRKMSKSSSHGSNTNLELLHQGEGLDYRMTTVDKGGKKPISLWHDITLVHIDPATNKPTPYLNFVNEIPKFSR